MKRVGIEAVSYKVEKMRDQHRHARGQPTYAQARCGSCVTRLAAPVPPHLVAPTLRALAARLDMPGVTGLATPVLPHLATPPLHAHLSSGGGRQGNDEREREIKS